MMEYKLTDQEIEQVQAVGGNIEEVQEAKRRAWLKSNPQKDKMEYTKGGLTLFDDGKDLCIQFEGMTIARVRREASGYAKKFIAAPDMYEACLTALGVMATLDQSKGWVKEISGVIQKALAKAEEK